MRTRSLALCAVITPTAALVHQYSPVPDGPLRMRATVTTTTMPGSTKAIIEAPSYLTAFLRERLGYTQDQIADVAGRLETVPPPGAVAALPERCARLARAQLALTPERLYSAVASTDEAWHDLLMELGRSAVAAQGPISVPPPRPLEDGEF